MGNIFILKTIFDTDYCSSFYWYKKDKLCFRSDILSIIALFLAKFVYSCLLVNVVWVSPLKLLRDF